MGDATQRRYRLADADRHHMIQRIAESAISHDQRDVVVLVSADPVLFFDDDRIVIVRPLAGLAGLARRSLRPAIALVDAGPDRDASAAVRERWRLWLERLSWATRYGVVHVGGIG